MADIDNGGPAFPFEGGANNGIQPCTGMTLRDYFAGQALIGFMAHPTYDSTAGVTARHCYEHADAMLAERAQGGQ